MKSPHLSLNCHLEVYHNVDKLLSDNSIPVRRLKIKGVNYKKYSTVLKAQFGCAPGILRTRVGFAGGTKENPTYRSLGDHTETVLLEFDADETNYR